MLERYGTITFGGEPTSRQDWKRYTEFNNRVDKALDEIADAIEERWAIRGYTLKDAITHTLYQSGVIQSYVSDIIDAEEEYEQSVLKELEQEAEEQNKSY